jgi:hypothetical protein
MTDTPHCLFFALQKLFCRPRIGAGSSYVTFSAPLGQIAARLKD